MSALCAVSPAGALERPADVWYGLEEQGGPFHAGLYIIGDSISEGVPYVATGASAGAHVWVRWQAGWPTYPHRRTRWGVSNLDSFTDAARSPASTVFVQLGTNDTNCMRAGNPLCSNDYPHDEAARQNEKLRITLETAAGTRTLLDAGKCVLWAGPRELARPGSAQSDAADMNSWLRDLERQYPNRFYYADYNSYSFSNTDLRYALDEAPGADRVHPHTAAGRQAIANFALFLARARCHLP
jgi:GDSL-like lipase/acylhydrolase family protein